MDKGTTIAIAGIAIAALSFAFTHLKSKSVSVLESDVAVIKKQVALFWAIVEKEIGNMLHSPHRAELDRLIEKNARREQLEDKELERMSELLQEIIEDEKASAGEKSGAIVYKAAVLARHAHGNH